MTATKIPPQSSSKDHSKALELFYKSSNDLLIFVDTKGQMTSANPAWTAAMGWESSALEGKLLYNFVHPEDAASTMVRMGELQRDLESRKDLILESRFLHKNGSWRILRWRMTPCPEVQSFGCSVQDVTSSRDVSNKPKVGVDFIKTVVDHLPVAVFCKDSKRNFELVVWNKTCEDWWGISEQQALGKNDYDFFPEEQASQYRKADTKVVEEGRLVDIAEEPTFHMAKGTITCHTLKVPVPDVDGTNRYLLGISEDISDRLRMKEEIEDRRAQAVVSARMATLGEMAGGIAHEINTPLAVILMRASHIQRMLQAKDVPLDKILAMANAIEHTAEQINKIVGGLRTFARSGEKDRFEAGSISTIVESTLALCTQQFEHHNIKLECIGATNEMIIECRLVQISQILLNLLSNAKYAVKETSGNRWVTINCEDHGSYVRIAVVDSGNGIAKEHRAKILEPFFTTKEVGEGTGLGLSISKGIAEDHKGKLYLDEDASHTTFVLELPKSQSANP